MIELSYAHDKQWVDMFVGTVPDVLMCTWVLQSSCPWVHHITGWARRYWGGTFIGIKP